MTLEIAPGIHRIKCAFGENRMVYVHLLVGEEASMLIDTGCAHNLEQEILPYLDKIKVKPEMVRYTLISHSDMDHQGGNAPWKAAAPQTILMCHELDLPWVEDTEALIKGRYSQFEQDHGIGYGEEGKAGIREQTKSHPIDVTLNGGEHFRLGTDWYVEVVHTPGHTWGHLSIYDPRSKTLIAGEASLWTSILDDKWQAAMPPTYCYIDTYLATQKRLLSMDIALFSSSHWPLQKGQDVKAFVSESANYCSHVEQQILAFANASESFTLRQAIDTLAPQLGDWPAGTNQDFSYGMLGHLKRMVQRNILNTSRNKEGLVLWKQK